MKKIIALLIVSFCLTSCFTTKYLDLYKLNVGMSVEQVMELAGHPEKVLAVRETEQGYLQVYTYRTPENDIYALEFLDNNLAGYQFLYEDYELGGPYVTQPILVAEPGVPIIALPPKYITPIDHEKPINRRPKGPHPINPPEDKKDRRPSENIRPSERPVSNVSGRPSQTGQPIESPRTGRDTRPVESRRPTENLNPKSSESSSRRPESKIENTSTNNRPSNENKREKRSTSR